MVSGQSVNDSRVSQEVSGQSLKVSGLSQEVSGQSLRIETKGFSVQSGGHRVHSANLRISIKWRGGPNRPPDVLGRS
jgi:hypothetical protein